jgi:uncharacterized protein
MQELLTDMETRVLAALVEKSYTTPEYYPLTLNMLVTACNQKSNREPVVAYDDRAVADTVELLRERGLAYEAKGDGRVPRYRHYFAEGYEVAASDEPLLCELMLRGPQTPGELRTHTERFGLKYTVAEMEEALGALAARESGPLVVMLPRKPGNRESRYAHTLAGMPADATNAPEPVKGASPLARIEDELATLHAEVDALRGELAEIKQSLGL